MRYCLAALILALPLPLSAGPLTPEALDVLPASDVVILGEVHDNPAHHTLQARAVEALQPAALVWEMMTPEQAARLPEDLRDAGAVDEAIGWAGRGWPDFAHYHPILLAAPGARNVGAEVPREQARRVFGEPLPEVFSDLFGLSPARFGLDRALPPQDQAAREALQAVAHCDALPEHLLPGMVAAQRLRDAALAQAVLAALDETGGPVAVITGWGHARRDTGLPRKLALAEPDIGVLSVAMLESDPGPEAPFDHWIVTAPHPREDPCAAFGE
ncbi:MAG: ChaN family lipoprotein [Pararhodobacter sp.]|nr:ChaN family lipoprotein [Pararhodobacter sp.]